TGTVGYPLCQSLWTAVCAAVAHEQEFPGLASLREELRRPLPSPLQVRAWIVGGENETEEGSVPPLCRGTLVHASTPGNGPHPRSVLGSWPCAGPPSFHRRGPAPSLYQNSANCVKAR